MKLSLALLIFLNGAIFAQNSQATFEVAAIKPSRPDARGGNIHNSEGEFTTSNITLRQLILYSLGAQDFQVTGGPAWIDDAHYDIRAIPDRVEDFSGADAIGRQAMVDRIRARVSNLLADRFHLQLREEQREVPIYVLTVDKGAPKLRAASEIKNNVSTNSDPQGGSIKTQGATLPFFCEVLSGILERPVTDRTSLTGAFDFDLKYSLDIAAPEAATSPLSRYPSIFTAVKEQLGLRLTGTKGPARTWVVVNAEPPTEN